MYKILFFYIINVRFSISTKIYVLKLHQMIGVYQHLKTEQSIPKVRPIHLMYDGVKCSIQQSWRSLFHRTFDERVRPKVYFVPFYFVLGLHPDERTVISFKIFHALHVSCDSKYFTHFMFQVYHMLQVKGMTVLSWLATEFDTIFMIFMTFCILLVQSLITKVCVISTCKVDAWYSCIHELWHLH